MAENMRFFLTSIPLFVLSIVLLPAHSHAYGSGGHPGYSIQPGQANDRQETTLIDIRKMSRLQDIIKTLTTRQAIYIGESHQQYSHHIAQLDIIKALHKQHPDIAIGMEMFQQPFQQHLDAFIQGKITAREMLRRTEYFSRWGYDYRLYQPILEFARANKIPVIALNIEKEISTMVSKLGIDGLDKATRTKIPLEIDMSNQDYRQRLQQVYNQHPTRENDDFERFLQVQILWDESMASRVSAYLQQHPESKMVILAGTGHVAFGHGIPDRVSRRTAIDSAIIIPGDGEQVEPGIGDYIIYPRSASLPKRALMGILMGEDSQSGIAVKGLSDDSAAARAGIKKDDRILRINTAKITSRADVRLALLEMKPGDEITVLVNRSRLLLDDEKFELKLVLGP